MSSSYLESEDVEPPGAHYIQAPAFVCEEGDGELLYSSFPSAESLDDYLGRNAVEGVRLNDEEVLEESELLREPEKLVKSVYSDGFRAAVYGKEEFLTFESEEVESYSEDLFEDAGEKGYMEVLANA